VEILPVDSEHCAIYQSLKSGRQNEIKSLVLTASGGPFFGKTKDELRLVTLEETLAHPTWKMGKKITVDSATLMNKGFEIIEAAHLFGVSADKIQVVIHRESILHSAVEYIDNSIIGEMSVPDMRMCVQYAVDYPERHATQSEPLSLEKIGRLTFMSPDTEAFPLLALAKRAMSAGGACPAIVNAADEVAVGAFLRGELKFYRISEAVAETFEKMPYARDERTLDGILAMDREARAICGEIIKEKMN
ncbi:MAG: 1-deoxy-D-xylulose-5-phosphate reductoisomerase, partial [Clostridia bacterium]|nr:1-deoxy-D-xylulose-5-phosphate reductoisomerase [Clostridia bacterium]